MKIPTLINGSILAAAMVLAGCAFNQSNADTLDATTSARVAHACKDIMGFSPGETQYEDCVLSLRQTAEGIAQAKRVQDARVACAQKALQPGTPEFSRCVLSASDPNFHAAEKQS